MKLRQSSKSCKRVLKTAKLADVNKAKESITSQKLGSCDFRRIAHSALSLLQLIKQNCLLKAFRRTYLSSHLELIWNFIIFL